MDQKITDQIVNIARKYKEISKISLFGSRARGACVNVSDIDLALHLYNDTFNDYALFCDEINEIDTLLHFDIVIVNDKLKPQILSNIKREEIMLMNRLQEKYGDFKNAVARLEESIREFDRFPNTTMRDGAIQRFEFTEDLAWKTAKLFLEDQGFAGLNSPKTVIKQVFKCGLITDEKNWINLLNDRNVTSHIYSEELANEIFGRIVKIYCDEFKMLLEKLAVSFSQDRRRHNES